MARLFTSLLIVAPRFLSTTPKASSFCFLTDSKEQLRRLANFVRVLLEVLSLTVVIGTFPPSATTSVEPDFVTFRPLKSTPSVYETAAATLPMIEASSMPCLTVRLMYSGKSTADSVEMKNFSTLSEFAPFTLMSKRLSCLSKASRPLSSVFS